ncbi:MAG: aminotransferase class III-fold pyridoxal phosphate-dependent enzyme [Acidobacteriota bacterium]
MAFASGSGQYLYDEAGQKWLDAGISNALVGHGNAQVTEAVARQLALIDTTAGHAHALIERYRGRLLSLFPPPLTVCYFLPSRSEATEMALRLARAHRPGKDVIVLPGADYGITTSLTNMSPLRFQARGGSQKHWVHVASRLDAGDVELTAANIQASGRGLCGFFAEGVFEPGYLGQAYAEVRKGGGLCVSVESQTGMGRVGKAMWEFARHTVSPDIVVIGESIANGFPMAAVVTTPALAAPFGPLFDHRSLTGSPVACAAALAVLGVLEQDYLADHAMQTGKNMRDALRALSLPVRGSGLCLEIDVQSGRDVINRLRENQILLSARGDTLLFRPPLTFTNEDASTFVEVLQRCL